MVADLVAEVAEQRAVGLVEQRAAIFARGVVGFLEGKGDDAALVAGEDRRGGDVLVEELEAQAVDGIFVARGERQVQAEQGIEQALLGALDHLPAGEIGGIGDVGHERVVAAGAADRDRRPGRTRPASCRRRAAQLAQ